MTDVAEMFRVRVGDSLEVLDGIRAALEGQDRDQILELVNGYIDRASADLLKLRGESNVQHEPEVRLNTDGTLDEVVSRSAEVHLEQMDFNHWFLSVGPIAVWLHAKGKITATATYTQRLRIDEGRK